MVDSTRRDYYIISSASPKRQLRDRFIGPPRVTRRSLSLSHHQEVSLISWREFQNSRPNFRRELVPTWKRLLASRIHETKDRLSEETVSLEPRQTRVCRVSVFHAAKLSRFRERGGFEDRFQTRSITYFHLPTSIGAGTHKPSILHVPRARSFRFKVLSIRLHQDPRGRSANQVSEERWPAICRSSANDKHETLFLLSLVTACGNGGESSSVYRAWRGTSGTRLGKGHETGRSVLLLRWKLGDP